MNSSQTMKIEKVLAGIDLGPDTGKVLAYASLFAKGLGASLHVLHVIDFLVTPPAYLDRYIEEEEKNAEEKFGTWKDRLRETGIEPALEVVVGRLQESFHSEIGKLKAGMLVIGFQHHALRRSSSEKLIKTLEMPVLVAKGKKAESAGIGSVSIRKVLCPVDFSEAAKKALKAAAEVASIFSSEIEVAHVVPTHVIKQKMVPGEHMDRLAEELLGQARGDLSDLLATSGIGGEGIILEGEPPKEIISLASRNDVDLIVMGARGHSFIRGILIGSVTDAVLRAYPCPVLVIH